MTTESGDTPPAGPDGLDPRQLPEAGKEEEIGVIKTPIVPGYIIGKTLGRGGMGAIFEAQQFS